MFNTYEFEDRDREYLNSKYKSPSEELHEFREVGDAGKVPIILKDTESLLKVLLKMKKPERILEIGTAIGYSATFFAEVCPDAEIYTIEKDEYAFNAAIMNIARNNLEERVHLMFGDGQEQTEKLRDKGINGFDFVFIDAAKSHYKRFLESALEVCNDEALIVSDNILQHSMTSLVPEETDRKHRTNIRSMRSYIDFITTDKRFDTSLLTTGDGMAITIYHKG